MVAAHRDCPEPRVPPGVIKKPHGLRAKLALSRGKPNAVLIELLDGSTRPPFVLLSRTQAERLADDITAAARALPQLANNGIETVELGA